ncbi:MAG: hypothetical protein ACO1OQ_12685 [Rufibacter sp.]
MYNKITIRAFLATALFWAGSFLPAEAQDYIQEALPVDSTQRNSATTPKVGVAAPVPRVSYSLSAGAAFSNFGNASFIEPRVQYRVTPRFHVFSSLTMIQNWNTPMLAVPSAEGGNRYAAAMPSRQYLLHVGGTYAMTDKLLLSGSVWKDLSSTNGANRWNSNPYLYNRFAGQQGFHFQAQYQVSPNVTISGGVRYSNGAPGYWGSPTGFSSGYPGGGFYSPY